MRKVPKPRTTSGETGMRMVKRGLSVSGGLRFATRLAGFRAIMMRENSNANPHHAGGYG